MALELLFMRFLILVVSVGFVASSTASAAQIWTPSPAGNGCSLPSLKLDLTPAGDSSSAVMLLEPAEKDLILRVRLAPEPRPYIKEAKFIFPSDGLFADGTASVRVSVDGKVIPKFPPVAGGSGSARSVSWIPRNYSAWNATVLRGQRLRIDYLSEALSLLYSREIDLSHLQRGFKALSDKNWKC